MLAIVLTGRLDTLYLKIHVRYTTGACKHIKRGKGCPTDKGKQDRDYNGAW